MIAESVILTFDGAIITGLFVFYTFFIALAGRIEHAGRGYIKEYVNITNAIYSLALVQVFFSFSAICVLLSLDNLALASAFSGLIVLVAVFFLLAFTNVLVERYTKKEIDEKEPKRLHKRRTPSDDS